MRESVAGIRMCVLAYVSAAGGQRLMSHVFLYCFSTLVFETIKLGITICARQAGQQAPVSHLPLVPALESQICLITPRCYSGSGNPTNALILCGLLVSFSCQLDIAQSDLKESDLGDCLHQIGLQLCLWSHFLN